MTRPDCEKFRKHMKELEETLAEREKLIAELRRKLAPYENPNTPPSRRMYPSRSHGKSGKRFPGRPKGHPGKTRPRPRPDIVKPPPRKKV